MQESLRKVFHSTYPDILHYKRLEKALHESEERLKTMVEYASEAIVILDVDSGLFIDMNEKAEKLYGRERVTLLGMGPIELSPKFQPCGQLSKDLALQKIREAVSGHVIEFEWTHLNGCNEEIECLVRLVRLPSSRFKLIRANIVDISERKRMERERRKFEDRVKCQQSTILKLATHESIINGRLEEAARVIAHAASHALDVERVGIWLLSPCAQQLTCIELYEKTFNRHSHGIRLHANSYPHYFSALKSGRIVDAHDVQHDMRTKEFNEQYLIPLGITSMLDSAIIVGGKIVGVVCHEHIGPKKRWSADEMAFAAELADQVAQVMLHQERMQALRDLRHARDELEKRVEERTAELQAEIIIRKKAEAKEKALRDQLIQAEKLSSIGLLAAGIAHELNNPLTGLLSLLRTYRNKKEKGSDDYEDLTHMLIASDHMARIVEDLNSFSRYGADGEFERVNLNDVIEATFRLCQHQLIRNHITITKLFADDLPSIKGNKVQLQQVILNLITNACDAMEDGGELTVETGYRPKKQTVFVCVKDTGCGILQEHQPKIFDPFFTTKLVGRGIGLGLFVLHGIVKSHKGEVVTRSAPGEGASFIVELPLGRRLRRVA